MDKTLKLFSPLINFCIYFLEKKYQESFFKNKYVCLTKTARRLIRNPACGLPRGSKWALLVELRCWVVLPGIIRHPSVPRRPTLLLPSKYASNLLAVLLRVVLAISL
jgi:hypothetical protein